MSQKNRVQALNTYSVIQRKSYIVYWCYKSVRTTYNHSLEYAIHLANKHTLPLVVLYTISDSTRSERHAMFELQALPQLHKAFTERKIMCIPIICTPIAGVGYVAQEAAALVVDKVYLHAERTAYKTLLRWVSCPVIQVESNVVIPVETLSDTTEYSAATIRRKAHKHINEYLVPISQLTLESPSTYFQNPHLKFPAQYIPPGQKTSYQIFLYNIQAYAHTDPGAKLLPLDRSVPAISSKRGGATAASAQLSAFIENILPSYAQQRNNPAAFDAKGAQSGMSPYLHYGHISPIEIAIALQEQRISTQITVMEQSIHDFLEELIIRRELAINFVYYHQYYDTYDSIPQWAKTTIDFHTSDHRPIVYSQSKMESAQTDDVYWNAAQQQLITFGCIHGYMRMYWAKKIFEWMLDPKEAYAFTVLQNDKYALDGSSPNGYAGISWCYGTHDRPWPERPIFGTVRYMNANGIRNKFKHIDRYVQRMLRV